MNRALILLCSLELLGPSPGAAALASEDDGGPGSIDGSLPGLPEAATAAPPDASTAAPPAPMASPAVGRGLVALTELQPIFAVGPFAEAKRAFDDGRYPEALALFDKQAAASSELAGLPPEARYVRAQALIKASRLEEASRELLALADRLPALRSRCLFAAAAALEDLKAFQAAASVYAQVSADSPLHRDALLGESRARAALGSAPQLDAASEPSGR